MNPENPYPYTLSFELEREKRRSRRLSRRLRRGWCVHESKPSPDRNPQNPSPKTLTPATEREEPSRNGATMAGDSMADARHLTGATHPSSPQHPWTRNYYCSCGWREKWKLEPVVMAGGACMLPNRSRPTVAIATVEAEEGDSGSNNTQNRNPSSNATNHPISPYLPVL